MKNSTKYKIGNAITTLLSLSPLIILLLIAIGYIVLRIYCYINYGNLPVTDVPAWVWWVMHGGGGK